MKLLVISGGQHPYEESTPVLEAFLKDAGHDATVTWEAGVLGDGDAMGGYDALVFNTRRDGETVLAKNEQEGMKGFISSGGGFVCIHISGCVPDAWPEYRDVTGGGWVTGESYHPPYGKMTVNIKDPSSAGAQGISDFETSDELYMGVELTPGNDVFITADAEEGTFLSAGKPRHMPGGTFPLGWTRRYGEGKVFVTLLGHDGLSLETPEFQRIVLNGVGWVTNK
jgi:type 1 glutamine amidotransferase